MHRAADWHFAWAVHGSDYRALTHAASTAFQGLLVAQRNDRLRGKGGWSTVVPRGGSTRRATQGVLGASQKPLRDRFGTTLHGEIPTTYFLSPLDAAIDELDNGVQKMAPWLTAVLVVVLFAALGVKLWIRATGRGFWGRISIPIRKRRK